MERERPTTDEEQFKSIQNSKRTGNSRNGEKENNRNGERTTTNGERATTEGEQQKPRVTTEMESNSRNGERAAAEN